MTLLKKSLVAGFTLAGLMLSGNAAAIAQAAPDNTTLKFALVFSRHGVRPPTKTNDSYNPYASQNFPDWSVAPGFLTVHGAQLMTIMGGYYRQYFMQQGLITGNDSVDVNSEYFYSDNAERTFATGQALAAGLLPSVTATVNELAGGAVDPLFYPVKVNLGNPDTTLAAAALNGRSGSNPAALYTAYKTQFGELESVLLNQPATGDPTHSSNGEANIAGTPLVVSPGTAGSIVNIGGGVDLASTFAEIFILEYCDGKDAGQIGWGRLTADQITDIAKLHTIDFDLTDRTPYLAQTQGSNLLLHIVSTINQAVTNTTTPHALGTPAQKLVMLTGHDNQLAAVGGLLRADWSLPSFANDDTPPGGSMTFELRQDPAKNYIVRLYYTAQTMDQQHDATPLSLTTPPGIAPIFIPNASTSNATFDMPLATFNSVMASLINTAYTN